MTDPRPSKEDELIEFVRSIDAKAPDSLHRQVESLIAGSRRAGGRRGEARGRRSFGRGRRLASAGALAAAVAALAIVLATGGGSSTLSARDAAAVTLRPATHGAPGESASNHAELAAAVEGVSFPYWGGNLGWRAIGARTDRLGGQMVMTVFYADGSGQRIGYAIVAGPPPRPSGGVVRWLGTTPYRLLSDDGAAVVMWLRDGHMCIVSGRGMRTATLLRLASSRDYAVAAS